MTLQVIEVGSCAFLLPTPFLNGLPTGDVSPVMTREFRNSFDIRLHPDGHGSLPPRLRRWKRAEPRELHQKARTRVPVGHLPR